MKNTTMNKTSIFWMSAAMALSDVVMLRCTAGTPAALIYALLAGSAMVIMVQAATAHLEQV
jgi:hypothetical protein